MKGEKTGGVQRMRKERRDLEERAIKANGINAVCSRHPVGKPHLRERHLEDSFGSTDKYIIKPSNARKRKRVTAWMVCITRAYWYFSTGIRQRATCEKSYWRSHRPSKKHHIYEGPKRILKYYCKVQDQIIYK